MPKQTNKKLLNESFVIIWQMRRLWECRECKLKPQFRLSLPKLSRFQCLLHHFPTYFLYLSSTSLLRFYVHILIFFFVKTYTDIYLYVLHNTYKNIFNVHTFPKISVMYRTILSWFVFVSCHICYWHVTIKILKWTSMWAQMLQSKRIMFYFLWLNFFVFSFC